MVEGHLCQWVPDCEDARYLRYEEEQSVSEEREEGQGHRHEVLSNADQIGV